MSSYLGSILVIALFLGFAQHEHANAQEMLSSPDGSVSVTVALKEKLAPAGLRLYYRVRFNDSDVLLDSPFGLDFKDAPPFAEDLAVTHVERRSVDRDWQRLWGRRARVADHFNEMRLTMEETRAPNRSIDLVFRAYDDGVAFRYELPEAWGAFKLADERSTFHFAGNPRVWAANFGGYQSSQETEFHRMTLDEMTPNAVYGCPVLFQVGPSVWAALTEANLTDWAGMYLKHSGNELGTLTTSLAPRLDERDVVVRSEAPRSSPWRVVMLGTQPGFLASDLVQNLNDPPEGDFSWVEPGKAAWDWWNGPYAPDADFEVGMNTATMKYFVDFAAEMGWTYHLVDAGWYRSSSGPGGSNSAQTDITQSIPQIDMPELVRYATEKGVKILVWLHWSAVNAQMDEAFPLYEKWGVHGVKIDFMNRDDQEMVNFYHRTVKKAAEHHLMVDFHGAYKPTGWSRTYPNVITREGVMGNEYNKWSDRITPEHTVTIPFTRGILGEMDFTPGGFLQKTTDTFEPNNSPAYVMGTRVHQLAMLVVYESALQVLCDSPYNYRSSPAGTDFLKVVPTTWDDTRVLAGYPGDFITVARRSGPAWYLASMSDEQARRRAVPLAFLGSGRWRAEIWSDAYESGEYPDRLMKQVREVTSGDTLTVWMAPGGGHIVRLTPVP